MFNVTGEPGRAGTFAQAEARLPGKNAAAAVEADIPATKRRRVSMFSVFEEELDMFRGKVKLFLADFTSFSTDGLRRVFIAAPKTAVMRNAIFEGREGWIEWTGWTQWTNLIATARV
jgi:hypothetical protein